MKKIQRRRLLQAGAAGLALPFLGRSRVAEAGEGGPKRLVVFHWPQGTVLEQMVPTGSENSFTLPYILEPLQPHQNKLTVLSGIDNRMPTLNSVGNAHFNANYTFLTGRPFLTQDEANLSAAGPSFEQLVADQIAGPAPYNRLDFAVGGPESTDGLFSPFEGSYFWHGAQDPVAYFNDPATALIRIFGDNSISPEDAWALRSRRASVLDGVLDQMGAMMKRLPKEDRLRLAGHREKLFSLEQRIVAGTGDCQRPDLQIPSGYAYGVDDPVSAGLFSDILVSSLRCDLSRVATLHFANGHAPTFPWLTAQNGGNPIVTTPQFDNWHAMVHADYQSGMEHVYRWYMEMLAGLLGRLAATTDADGDNLLDTTLVVALSEYSSGRHWNRALPVILAGNTGDAPLGRWLNFMSVGMDQWNGYQDSNATTNQLWTSILQLFGSEETTFGHVDPTIPNGPLPGFLT